MIKLLSMSNKMKALAYDAHGDSGGKTLASKICYILTQQELNIDLVVTSSEY